MFDLVHAMRTRVVTSPAFDGSRILAAILFEQTMERDIHGVPAARYLWDEKQVVPFLKVDKGLADEENGVRLMKPIDTLDELLARGKRHRIFGTKMRSLINDADMDGVTAIVDQQFEYGARISAAGLVPIIEPEVSISSPRKDEAETLLRDALQTHISALPHDATVLLKLTIPTQPGRYAGLAADPRVLRVLALSGGYRREEACELLAKDPSMIASFSRALLEGLSNEQRPTSSSMRSWTRLSRRSSKPQWKVARPDNQRALTCNGPRRHPEGRRLLGKCAVPDGAWIAAAAQMDGNVTDASGQRVAQVLGRAVLEREVLGAVGVYYGVEGAGEHPLASRGAGRVADVHAEADVTLAVEGDRAVGGVEDQRGAGLVADHGLAVGEVRVLERQQAGELLLLR
jgi:fructose-bisphosphate aldolase class I